MFTQYWTDLVNCVANHYNIPLTFHFITSFIFQTWVTHLQIIITRYSVFSEYLMSWCHKIFDVLLTTSAGFWHMTVSWVISSVLKLYWQYSDCLVQSSVMFLTLTTSTFLIWILFWVEHKSDQIKYLQTGTVLLVQIVSGTLLDEDFIKVQLIS